MPTTRRKVNKPVYKDENDSEQESVGDFSDSGSEADIPEATSSDEEPISDDDFQESPKKPTSKLNPPKKTKFVKEFYKKINKQSSAGDDDAVPAAPAFSVKDLTAGDKLLPSFLNLSESDSSDDDTPKAPAKKTPAAQPSSGYNQDSDGETSAQAEYKDVWSQYLQDNSEEVAKKTFMELEQHKTKIEETKASIMKYKGLEVKHEQKSVNDVKDLLALGEEVIAQTSTVRKNRKIKKVRDDSDSEKEDWEEVKDAKSIPQQGLQLVVDFPDAHCRKSKKVDVEMIMKRKINRVKKEYQVYMHKVHVLCWLAHGNYVSRVLNDQEILAAALSLVPSKECYPGERVDMKYLEQITSWYKDKLTLKQDKNEAKFKPKAPPLNEILKAQIRSRVVTAKKYLVFVFVSMLRALGLQCRIMFNFTTLPIKPPSSELCSLSTKAKEDKNKSETQQKQKETKTQPKKKCASKTKNTISQVDGNDDSINSDDTDYDDIIQLDGNDDKSVKTRGARTTRKATNIGNVEEDVSPPKRLRKNQNSEVVNTSTNCIKKKNTQETKNNNKGKAKKKEETIALEETVPTKSNANSRQSKRGNKTTAEKMAVDGKADEDKIISKQITKKSTRSVKNDHLNDKNIRPPEIVITPEESDLNVSSEFFENTTTSTKRLSLARNRSKTAKPSPSQKNENVEEKPVNVKTRTKSAPSDSGDKSKYFDGEGIKSPEMKRGRYTRAKEAQEDKQRISHRDINAKNKAKPKNDVTGDLVDIIKKRVKEAKENSKRGKVKAKAKDSDHDSDYLPEEESKNPKFDSDDEFKPSNIKISPRPSTSKITKKIDRRVLSSDSEELSMNKCNFWCEVFVEELEQWIAVDVIRAKVHCTNEIYNRATNPVCYVVGWDNNNYLKDLTRRYVPHWNTVTRKLRVEPVWWQTAIQPWIGPKTPRDREEDEQLDRMQMDAPLPKSIAEYKNHPLYALKRHLLKFEAIYPADAATLGFVRNEAVYARDCVYVCRSRDTWLKEAKVVRLGEQPYKVVKARPKWDKLSNKLITDKPLEVFGPWQVSDYEPPVAENGVVPRNAYGNVELFKDCMLPKGTVHLKLPGLNRVAKKLNIDCAPAMTGFDFNGGWSHPVYDGFVVCEEFSEIITDAWVKDKEEQERREIEKLEARVYGNWKRLIKGLFIRERLKNKYGFEEPQQKETKNKGPKLVVKKK